jgi:hypothetical protein
MIPNNTSTEISGGHSSGSTSTQSSPAAEQKRGDTASQTAPAIPAHNYVYKKDGVYGYEVQLSKDQVAAGAASAPLVMVRYLGQSRGAYRAEIMNRAFTTILSCTSPCSYITAREYYYNPYAGSQLIDKKVVPAGTTVAAGIMQDAMNGQLIPYDQRPAAIAARARQAAYKRERLAKERAEYITQERERRAAKRKAEDNARERLAIEHEPPYVTTAAALMFLDSKQATNLMKIVGGRRVQISGRVSSIRRSQEYRGFRIQLAARSHFGGSEGFVKSAVIYLSSHVTIPTKLLAFNSTTTLGPNITVICTRADFTAPLPSAYGCQLAHGGQ